MRRMAYCVRITQEQEDACFKAIDYSRQQLAQDVVAIRDWVNEQDYLPPSCRKERDGFIIHYLMGCKGSLEKTKRKLLAYYGAKSSKGVVNKNLDPFSPSLIEAHQVYQMVVLPASLDDGTRVSIGRIAGGKFRGDGVSLFKVVYTLWEVINRWDHEIRPNTWISVVDTKGAGQDIVAAISPNLSKEGLDLLQKTMPYRIRNIIFLNCPKFIELAVNYLARPFMSKKLRDRVIVTSEGPEFLINYIPKKVLPRDYGGEGPMFSDIYDDYQKEEKAVAHLLIGDWADKIDESKRPPHVDDWNDLDCGLHGSIKKLCVD